MATIERLLKMADSLEATNFGTRRVPPARVPYPGLASDGELTPAQQWISLLWSIESSQAHGRNGLQGLAVALSHIVLGRLLEEMLLDAREFHHTHLSPSHLLWDESLPLLSSGETMRTLPTRQSRAVSVHLNDAVVLPSPWERYRLHGALHKMGEKRAWGAWRQDPNHYGIGWKPWPIVWIRNGHHSTMAALIRGGGRFRCNETFNFLPVLAAVRTDGANWYRRDNGALLGPVRSVPMAGIFVIGQRLTKCT